MLEQTKNIVFRGRVVKGAFRRYIDNGRLSALPPKADLFQHWHLCLVLTDTVDKVGRRRSSRNERSEINVSVKLYCRDGVIRESILRSNGQKIVYQQYRPKADNLVVNRFNRRMP